MSHFKQHYTKQYMNEPQEISHEMYNIRKWKVLRNLSKQQLLEDFLSTDGFKVQKTMTKEAILKYLKTQSWRI